MKTLRYLVVACWVMVSISACHASNADNPTNSAPDRSTKTEQMDLKNAEAQANDTNYVDPNEPAVVVTDSAKAARDAMKKTGK